MKEDLEQTLDIIRKNTRSAINELNENLNKVFSSIPKLDFPEIPSLQFETGTRDLWESIPKPAVLDDSFSPAIKAMTKAIEDIDLCYTIPLPELSAIVEQAKSFTEEWDRILAPIRRQFEIATRLSRIGEKGWTSIPETDFESYMNCPIGTQDETDAYFMSLLTEDVIDSLLIEIASFSDGESDDDINEAIYDYKDGRYKSSALIMFSLIDGILIKNHRGEIYERYKQKQAEKQKQTNKQKQAKKQKQKGRPVGVAAAKSITDYFGQCPASFHFYLYMELKSCLPKVFAFTKDFSIPEHPINRNMVAHGMQKRRVEKKDCLQLFLLFRNFVRYILDFNEQFADYQEMELGSKQ